ncbi:MAG: hypothetical protein WAO52_18510 [Prolixibacteraceae bacterium]
MPKLKSTSWRDNWKFEFMTGVGTLFSEVPEKYLDRINNVNIPTLKPGPTAIFSVKKGLTSHLEMGYQLDFMRIAGDVNQEEVNYHVLTQTMGNSFILKYNLKPTNEFRPRYNYYIFYRIGAISLKNNPTERRSDGSLAPNIISASDNSFIKNVAIVTGIGIGVNYQLSSNLSLIGTVDLNRSADVVDDIYKPYKIFYNSENTVNSFTSVALGLSYAINISEKKRSTFFNSNSETDKRLKQVRIKRKKGHKSTANLPVWYNHNR